jgi:hypothetical protein
MELGGAKKSHSWSIHSLLLLLLLLLLLATNFGPSHLIPFL